MFISYCHSEDINTRAGLSCHRRQQWRLTITLMETSDLDGSACTMEKLWMTDRMPKLLWSLGVRGVGQVLSQALHYISTDPMRLGIAICWACCDAMRKRRLTQSLGLCVMTAARAWCVCNLAFGYYTSFPSPHRWEDRR